MGPVSTALTACIFSLLCPFGSPTPVEKGPIDQVPQEPEIEPRAVVTKTKYEVYSAVQSNPPFYDTACKVGGCTFSYEVSRPISSISCFY